MCAYLRNKDDIWNDRLVLETALLENKQNMPESGSIIASLGMGTQWVPG